MKVHELLEADDRPIQTKSGKLADILGNAEIAPEVMDTFKQKVKELPPEDKQKINDMGGIKPFWNDFKQTATYKLEVYRDRGVFTMSHPTLGRLEQTINMNIGNLDNGEVSVSGASVKTTAPGNYSTRTSRVGQADFDKARAAVDTELNRQGVNPATGMRK